METAALRDTKKMKAVREIITTSKPNELVNRMPPTGFMTGDEFERRVKKRVTQFYKENIRLQAELSNSMVHNLQLG